MDEDDGGAQWRIQDALLVVHIGDRNNIRYDRGYCTVEEWEWELEEHRGIYRGWVGGNNTTRWMSMVNMKLNDTRMNQ